MMKKTIIFAVAVSIFASCSLVQDTAYSINVFNNSSSSLLVEYETKDKTGSMVLHNDIHQDGYWTELHREWHPDKDLEKYTKEEFESIVHSIKLSIVNGTDTIPLSKEFAPFENWTYYDHYDDYIMEHDFRLIITDDMLD